MNLRESIYAAFQSIRGNKLRASLTLIGIIIGVFSIIGVMTLVDALQKGIDSGLSQLGSNTFQVQKFPALFVGGPGKFHLYEKRKDITLQQAYELKNQASIYKIIGFEDWLGGRIVKTDKYQTNPNISLCGCTPEFLEANTYTLASGRFFTEQDINSERDIAVIGMDVVDKLFPNTNPLGQEIVIDGNRFQVVGILAVKGNSFGQSMDNIVLIPIKTIENIYGARKHRSINITVTATSKETYDATVEHIIGVMRQVRKVPPCEDNDFEIFSNESLIRQTNDFTKYFKYGAGVISFISLLAAGVGIMNIMLVTVTERTKEIGIRMAIGAKRSNILSQFLFEAIVLCQMGGIVGIILGIVSGNLLGTVLNTPVAIPYDWVVIGIIICSAVGILFGTYPAYKAARLNPIDALRYE